MLSLLTKKDPLNKENYRSVSLLSHMSKVFERLLHKQIETFMSNKLSNRLSGFRKNYNTQYCLTYMLEKWKNTLDKGKHVGAVSMDLSKAFDTINHGLLIAKLEVYGFSNNALLFMLNYLKNRSQRVSINSSFSTWEEIIAGLPQGSILEPLLFNIFLNDIFYFQNRSFLQREQSLSKTRGITKNLKYVGYAKEKSSVQFYNKISIQLLPTCLDVLFKKIKFSSDQCS